MNVNFPAIILLRIASKGNETAEQDIAEQDILLII